jgi:S-adenosylmethionine-diacylglycerol 3-amino-3-carboxypropyl transferase
MQSEFYNVALDQLRYALVWEDHRTLYRALQLRPEDHALVITSAGCNVLNTLLEGPARVTAIDLNPAQNALLGLKRHLIAQCPPTVLRGVMGFDGPAGVAAAWRAAAPTFPPGERTYWTAFFTSHPAGIATSGRLESYLTSFWDTLDTTTQTRLRQLLDQQTIEEQMAFFRRELDGTAFEHQFVSYFDRANLSKGRDPRLFRYATESGGRVFYQRLCTFLGRQLARDAFHLRFFFFGPEGLPEAILPPCYQAANHERLRASLSRLHVVTGEATEFLLSTEEGQSVTKASLSNIFEYVSPEEFSRVCEAFGRRSGHPLRAVFWNLLQDQGEPVAAITPLLDGPISETLSGQEGCFYFRNVRVLEVRAQNRPAAPLHHEHLKPA